MGIPKLGEWLKTQNIKLDPRDPYDLKSSGYKGKWPEPDFSTEGMLIDMPDLLHYVAQKTYHYQIFEELGPISSEITDVELEIKYLNELTNILETYIEEFQPKQYFIVAIDGAVPLGKIYEQRKRRLASRGEMTTPRWSIMYLTPGTPFMAKINIKLREWFESYPKLPKYSIYSGYQVPGEGEHKMFKYLKNALAAGDIVEGSGLHIYTGQDGDLLMIGSLVSVKNLVWLRQERDAKSFKNNPTSITAFRNRITSIFGRGRLYDFILMIFMYGNDFIPHHPALAGPSISVAVFADAYKEMKLSLVTVDPSKNNKATINKNNLNIFFNIMAEKEKFLMNEEAKHHRSLEGEYQLLTDNISLDSQKRLISFDFYKFRRDWYIRVLREYYPEKLESSKTSLDDHIEDLIQKMTSSYIDMLQWNLDYYLGETENISWERAYPYVFAPLFCDLAQATGAISSSVDEGDDGTSSKDINSASIIRQLLMVIHPKIMPKIVPYVYARLVTDPDPNVAVLSKFSPDEPKKYPDGHSTKENRLWYSVLPMVSIDDYDEAITTVKATGRGDLPDYMQLRKLPLIRKTNIVGEVKIIRSTPKPGKDDDSKFVWVRRQLM
jgi:5'-3' exonuclease